MNTIKIEEYRFRVPKFENELDTTLWIIDIALDRVWQQPGPFQAFPYFILRNMSYHLQGKHEICREGLGCKG